jgi:26S proteasome regulatory subunit, ATPase 3, interacting protein
VDISANLKGAVPKTATQKILLALAERGEVTQKNYGKRIFTYFVPALSTFSVLYACIQPAKATFFVANQNTLDALPEHKVKALSEGTEALIESNKALTAEVKAASAGVYPRPAGGKRGGGGVKLGGVCARIC